MMIPFWREKLFRMREISSSVFTICSPFLLRSASPGLGNDDSIPRSQENILLQITFDDRIVVDYIFRDLISVSAYHPNVLAIVEDSQSTHTRQKLQDSLIAAKRNC